MRTPRRSYVAVALVACLAFLGQGIGGASAMHSQKSGGLTGTITIGQISTLTGAFSFYGQEQEQGFYVGLKYATNGTFKVDKAKLKIKLYSDVNSTSGLPDPAIATSDAKTAFTSDHVQILQCCTSSGNALAVAQVAAQYKKILMVAPAADDTISGINRYTFRTSREASQDALTGAKYAYQKFGHSYMTLAQDTAFGHSQISAWKGQLDKLHATDQGDVLFPFNATDFTPYIQQILSKKPNWLFLACAGTQCTSLGKQLDQQGLLDQVKVMTGLGNIASFPAYGDAGTKIGYMSVYYYKFPKTAANTYMVKQIKKLFNRPADIFDQDAFAAAQQIVAALKKTHSTNSQALIRALEGQTVQGPKGPYTIRKQDHVCLQPMYITKLTGSGTTFTPVLLATRSAKATAPPIQKHNW
jgi:branched-chain amino acid transport system substrate-binding protein